MMFWDRGVRNRLANSRTIRALVVRVLISMALFAVFAAHTVDLVNLRVVSYLEHLAYDTRMQADMPFTVDEDIVLVGVDEKSLSEVGRWPWPRATMADLYERLFEDYDIRQLGIDGVFSEPEQPLGAPDGPVPTETEAPGGVGTQPGPSDERLADVLEGENVILGLSFQTEGGPAGELPTAVAAQTDLPEHLHPPAHESYIGNLALIDGAVRSAGFADIPLFDEDGRVRRTPMLGVYNGQVYGSLALVMAQSLEAELGLHFEPPRSGLAGALESSKIRLDGREIPVDRESGLLIPYRGPEFSFPRVSAADVLSGEADPELLEDTVVLFGTAAVGLGDFHSTPVADSMSSIEVHAHVLSGLLDGRIARAPRDGAVAEIGILALVGALLTLAYLLWGGWGSAAATIGMMGGYTAFNLGVWRWADLVLPIAPVLSFIVLLYTLHLLYGHIRETRSRRELSTVFSHYVPQQLVDELMDNPRQVPLEGESRYMTVLFSDIHGFAGIAESLDPRELTQFMNEFLTAMTRVIQRRRGTIDKYMGDSVMAFWGAPLETPDHARQAVFAALEMQREMSRLNGRFRRRGWPVLTLGIGINTGQMSVGNMGSEFRMAYTVMGDAVNLGSRLEGLTRNFDVGILCSEFTRDAVPDVEFMELDRVSVRGREKPVTVYEPLGPTEELPEHTRLRAIQFEQALEDLREGRYREAAELLQRLIREDPARTRLYRHFYARADARAGPYNPHEEETLTRGGL